MDSLSSDDETSPAGEIARLEQRIEELEEKLDSCRKFAAAARFAIALGGVLLLGLLLGAIVFDPLALTTAMAAGLGGVVTLGSNQATARQAATQLAEAEAARAALVGSIDLRLVADRNTPQ
jgi:hypothetical protein